MVGVRPLSLTKWLMLNWIIRVNCEQIKLLVFDSNNWNHLTVYKEMSSGSYKNSYPQTIYDM